jgi:hypothetical protein
MIAINEFPLIEKVHFLESKLGEKRKYSMLLPFKFNSSNVAEVQKAGKIIQQHLGLPSLTFIITYVQQKSNVGGYIELDNNNEVFIEIDIKFRNDCDFILAILAHEICHKYLHVNGLKLFPEFENEMLTDAATVFMGLGKLSLNGCEKTSCSTSTLPDSTTKTTTTQKVGYMNRQQFAFIYRLIGEMNKVSQTEMLLGLTAEASSVVAAIELYESYYFNKKFFDSELAKQEILDLLKGEIEASQKKIATLDKDTRVY